MGKAAPTAPNFQQRARTLADVRDRRERPVKGGSPSAFASKEHEFHILQQPAAHSLLAIANADCHGAPWVVERESSIAIYVAATGLKDRSGGNYEAGAGLILYSGDESVDLAAKQPLHVQTAIWAR
jgi:hypothetical protein